jgi:uncharacterized protein YjiS (DUF1127 family)
MKAVLRGLMQLLYVWHARVRSRAHLAELDAYLLADMGLSQADIRFECAKPFWRP